MSYGEKRFEEFRAGDATTFSKTITEADILLFAAVSGDNYPLHVDAEYAKTTRFGQRAAHGMLTASLLSTVIGLLLRKPGGIYVEQSIRFKRPVFVEDTPVLTEDEQLRIGLPEVEHSHLHWTAPAAEATRTITPASCSMRASASERPSSVTSVPIRDSGNATLRAWIDSLRLSASTTIWSAQRLRSPIERTSSGCDSSTPSRLRPCAPRKNLEA